MTVYTKDQAEDFEAKNEGWITDTLNNVHRQDSVETAKYFFTEGRIEFVGYNDKDEAICIYIFDLGSK